MQQRQPRLGDILDDYCPRERRITNHAVVAMIGEEIKQTRCTTCDAEHEYKHARVPRQRRKPGTPAALYAQVLADAPKRVSPDVVPGVLKDARQEDRTSAIAGARVWADDRARGDADERRVTPASEQERAAGDAGRETADAAASTVAASSPVQGERDDAPAGPDASGADPPVRNEEGPVHRPLIRATLPRPEGQQPASRPLPEFTIRQPGARGGRFRPRHGRSGAQFHGGRSNGNLAGGPMRGDHPHLHRPGGRPPAAARPPRHQSHGRKRSK